MRTMTMTPAAAGSAVGVRTPVVPRVATPSLGSGMFRAAVTSLRAAGEVCLQALPLHAAVRIRTDLAAGAPATGGAGRVAATNVPQVIVTDRRFGTEQYGKPPHQTGTRVCRSSV